MTTPSPDYDVEAARYDETRGGSARAEAAATAVASLLHPDALVLDVGGGTGLVAERLTRNGFRPVLLDRSAGMLALALRRATRGVVQADAARLPVRDGSVDAVLLLWVLHLLPDAAPVLGEAARVLAPGGTLVTTVDKAYAHGYERAEPGRAVDARHRVLAQCAALGLEPAAETTFVGHGQARDGEPDPVFPLLAFLSARRPTVPA